MSSPNSYNRYELGETEEPKTNEPQQTLEKLANELEILARPQPVPEEECQVEIVFNNPASFQVINNPAQFQVDGDSCKKIVIKKCKIIKSVGFINFLDIDNDTEYACPISSILYYKKTPIKKTEIEEKSET